MNVEVKKITLKFKFPAGTSRGVLSEKDSWFFVIKNGRISGIGECSPIWGLSIEKEDNYLEKLEECAKAIRALPELPENINLFLDTLGLEQYPSIRFAMEVAFKDLSNGGVRKLFDNAFASGEGSIFINGLIWMGSKESMLKQVEEKLVQGFSCLKMKIGAIDFDQELEILGSIRERFSKDKIELRVDANGAFDKDIALERLSHLATFDLHSIEQPIAAGQVDAMQELCNSSPLNVALDEELIGISDYDGKVKLISEIRPQYIILKPSLLGGFKHCNEWIEIAEENNVGWWLTSALESNIGLNAIAQYAYELNATMPQGLGTGQLYHNNIPSPLRIDNGQISYDTSGSWQLNALLN